MKFVKNEVVGRGEDRRFWAKNFVGSGVILEFATGNMNSVVFVVVNVAGFSSFGAIVDCC